MRLTWIGPEAEGKILAVDRPVAMQCQMGHEGLLARLIDGPGWRLAARQLKAALKLNP